MEKISVWTKWARNLHRWRMDEPAEVFLNAIGPIAVIAAQSLVLLKPVITTSTEWDLLAEMLEDPEERKSFGRLLHEGHWDE